MKVPTYERQVGLTTETPGGLGPMAPQAPQGSLEAAGLPYQKLQEVGGALTLIAGEVKRHQEHAQQVNDLADAKMAAHEQLNGLQNLVKDYDPADRAEAFKQGGQDWFEQYSQNLKDPEVQAAFKTHWATWYPAKLQQVDAEAQKQRILNFAGNVEANWNKSIELYGQTDDPIEKARIKGDAFGMVDGGVGSLLVHPAQAEKMKQGWDKAVSLGQLNKDMLADAPGTLAALRQPGAYGLNETERAAAIPHVNSEVKRMQANNYSGYMQNILGATADNPVQGAVMPTEQEILPQIGKTLNVAGAQNILAWIRGQKASQVTGKENQFDPKSYNEIATRLTEPPDPETGESRSLTRAEYLKNIAPGPKGEPPEWKVTAKDHFHILQTINSQGAKLDKAPDSAFKAEIAFQKTQFSDPFGIGKEYYQTAVGQAWQAKNEGTLGKTSEEVKANLKEIFNNQMRPYQQDLNMGKTGPLPKPGIISRIGGYFGSQGGPAPAGTAVLPGNPRSIRNDKGWMSNDIRGSK